MRLISENKWALDISADLGPISLVKAYSFLNGPSFLESIVGEQKNLSHVLKIASQNLRYAITLAYIIGCTIEISTDYAEDEWSLTAHYIYKDIDDKIQLGTKEVWSAGA